VLRALAALPAGALVRDASGDDYESASAVFAALESRSATADARLAALGDALPVAASFVRSARGDLARHRRERQALGRRRGVAFEGAPAAVEVEEPLSLPRLRAALEELMHTHAEGLPALRDRLLVQKLAEHMVDLSRQVTVVDLWIEKESPVE
jgi:hypothetical protein